ncbi:MAG: elongation factor P maturation arginine rhamnosyltransferase EarP [Rubrivivax sp.]
MRWDLFCRVIDNHGDLGVCWRLARDLASRGDAVRLVVDDARALAWMAPQGAAGVAVLPWSDAPPAAVGDVVVEAFGCDPPPVFVDAMARRRTAPVWINLEYLSAEAYVERSHGLPSPQPGGLRKWFFYPGFTPRTGGLLREPGLMHEQAAFDRQAWLSARGWLPRPGERLFSLFSYPLPRLADWLPALAAQPTLLLAAPGSAVEPLRALPRPPGLRVIDLPWLTQPDYDRLLWSCDLNAVRGEDSFVRAQWAGQPLLWQIYPQHDGVHAAKLEAWLDRCLEGAPPALAQAVRQAQRCWNGLDAGPPALPDLPAWQAWQRHWRQQLLAQNDLTAQLRSFALERAGKP